MANHTRGRAEGDALSCTPAQIGQEGFEKTSVRVEGRRLSRHSQLAESRVECHGPTQAGACAVETVDVPRLENWGGLSSRRPMAEVECGATEPKVILGLRIEDMFLDGW